MGTFSVRSLRADAQNVAAMRRHRAFPGLMRFMVCYLLTCAAVYLYFRYFLTDDRDYGTPLPAAVTHDTIFRPPEPGVLLSGKVSAIPPKKVFEKIYRLKALKRPGGMTKQSWHTLKHDMITRLEEQFKDNGDPGPWVEKTSVGGNSLPSLDGEFRSTNSSYFNVTHEENNIKGNEKPGGINSTDIKADISIVAPKLQDSNFDLNMVEIISKPQIVRDSSMISHRFQDFRREWFRQRRARVDWQSMLKPCTDNMAWGLVKGHWGKVNRSSGRASEVVDWDIRPAGEFSKIFIQSKTADNRTKRIGGDSWRVNVNGPSNVASTVFDHQNGTYEAVFLLTEPGNYQLKIYLDYSLCNGFKDPPRDWFIKGNAQGKYQKDGLLGTLDDYLKEPLNNGHPLIINVPEAHLNTSFIESLYNDLSSCSNTCNHLWDGFGRWTNNTWRPYLEESYEWSLPFGYRQSGALWVFGDSLAVRLVNSVHSRLLCKRLYVKCLASYNWIYPVKDERVSKEEDDDLDFRPQRVIGDILNVLRNPMMQGEESVLLLNLGLHFPIGINFTTYQRLIGDLIHSLKEAELDSQGKRVPKYKAKIIWKTSSAIHKENALVKNLTNWRFFTTQRVALFSAYAMSAMCQAGYDVIDVYPMTDAYPGGIIDEVHYPAYVFSAMETMLEKYKSHSNKRLGGNERRNRIKRCIAG